MEKIDFVILWVDGSDPKWLKKREKYEVGKKSDDEVRFRDYGSLKYVFRSIEKYAPWVNKVHLITDKQIPEWLSLDNDKVNLVFHEDFTPDQYLPTFNSNVIELNLFRIPDLADKFILFNDDMFINNMVYPENFFKGDKILDFGVYNKIAPIEDFAHILVNNMLFINKYFNKKSSLKNNWKNQFRLRYRGELLRNFLLLPWNDIPGYYNPHIPQPHFKSLFNDLYNLEPDMFEKTFNNKFRGYSDINHWIARYWLLEKGQYLPQHKTFGKYLKLSDYKKVKKEIVNGKSKVICINDVESDMETFEGWRINMINAFKEKFPNKSTFEK